MPISAQLKYNIDVVCEYIVKKIPIPERNFISPPNMIVIRSFDVNKPGFEVDEIRGGVAGGSILRVCLCLYLLKSIKCRQCLNIFRSCFGTWCLSNCFSVLKPCFCYPCSSTLLGE